MPPPPAHTLHPSHALSLPAAPTPPQHEPFALALTTASIYPLAPHSPTLSFAPPHRPPFLLQPSFCLDMSTRLHAPPPQRHTHTSCRWGLSSSFRLFTNASADPQEADLITTQRGVLLWRESESPWASSWPISTSCVGPKYEWRRFSFLLWAAASIARDNISDCTRKVLLFLASCLASNSEFMLLLDTIENECLDVVIIVMLLLLLTNKIWW